MSRVFALLIAGILLGVFVIAIMTDQKRPGETFDMPMFVFCVAAQVVFLVGLLGYCGFAVLHAMQYLASPQDRSVWLVVILGLNVAGACYYFLTIYQTFRKEGKGRLMSFKVHK